MKASYKIFIPLIAVILMLSIGASLSIWAFKQTENSAEELKQTEIRIRLVNDILSEVKDAETGQRGFVITGNARFLEPFLAANIIIDSDLEELKGLTTNPNSVESLNRIEPLIS